MTDVVVASSDIMVAHLEGEAVLLHLGTKRYFQLNCTGAHIWKLIAEGARHDAIVESLVTTFEVDPAQASDALRHLVDDLLENALVREREDAP